MAKKAKEKKEKEGELDTDEGKRTWDSVIPQETTERLETFEDCIKEARKHLGNKLKTERFIIAAIALRVCEIERGGARRGAKWRDSQKLTMASFADGIGINRKTLFGWVDVYRFVRRALPGVKRIKLTACQDAMIWSNRTGEDPAELYHKFASGTDPRRRVFEVIKRVRVSAFFIRHHGVKYFLPMEKELLLSWAKLIQEKCQEDGKKVKKEPVPKHQEE